MEYTCARARVCVCVSVYLQSDIKRCLRVCRCTGSSKLRIDANVIPFSIHDVVGD